MATGSKFKIESGMQLLARLSKKAEITNFFSSLFEPGLKHGDTVEIFSNDNTSYLIIEILWEALHPIITNEEPTGVLFINTAGQFKYEEFVRILQNKIHSKFDTRQANQMKHGENMETEEILTKIFSNLQFLEIYDATQFYTTIHNLDSIFTKHSNISLIIIDTLTAFYWSEQGYKITKMDFYVKNLVKMIQKVSEEHKVVLIYTRPEYFSSSKCGDLETTEITNGPDFRIHLVYSSQKFYEANVKTSQKFYKKILKY